MDYERDEYRQQEADYDVTERTWEDFPGEKKRSHGKSGKITPAKNVAKVLRWREKNQSKYRSYMKEYMRRLRLQ